MYCNALLHFSHYEVGALCGTKMKEILKFTQQHNLTVKILAFAQGSELNDGDFQVKRTGINFFGAVEAVS